MKVKKDSTNKSSFRQDDFHFENTKMNDDNNNNTAKIQNINGASKLFSIDEITPTLLLCGASALRGNCLTDKRITCVITAAPELPQLPLPPTVTKYLRVNVQDATTANIASHLHQVADLVHQVDEEGGRTLVHCVAGVSRSASLCIGYLMKYWGLGLKEAYFHVHKQRSCIRPNSGFFAQLIDFEKELTGKTTVTMVHNSAAGGLIPDVYEADYENTMRYNSRSYGIK